MSQEHRTAHELNYVAIAEWGNCKICGQHDDLRYGSCFVCADHVSGLEISPGVHRLWDTRHPDNRWLVFDRSKR